MSSDGRAGSHVSPERLGYWPEYKNVQYINGSKGVQHCAYTGLVELT